MSNEDSGSIASPDQIGLPMVLERSFVPPNNGEVITSLKTNNTYFIGEFIAEGNFSYVYHCRDMWDNELVAKVLKPNGESYEVIRSKAEQELHRLSLLRHPSIIYVYDAFEYRDTFYIITEKCDMPLKNLFEINNYDGKLWIDPIARSILQGIHFIHLRGMVHKDLHADNVLVQFIEDKMLPNSSVMQFKIADLGIANFITNIVPESTVFARWMFPPEILNRIEFGEADHRIDIYHCGLLFLEVLEGRLLQFTEQEILDGVPRQRALALGAHYSFALEKALRRRVAFRTSSALEFWRDLKSIAEME